MNLLCRASALAAFFETDEAEPFESLARPASAPARRWPRSAENHVNLLEKAYMQIFEWIRRKWQGRNEDVMFEQRVIVTATSEEIAASYPSGEVQKILWKDVGRVAIETNDSGPAGADFWWLIEGETNRCCFPQGATGEADMFALLSARFAGFRYEKFIEACGCTSNARFICWERVIADKF